MSHANAPWTACGRRRQVERVLGLVEGTAPRPIAHVAAEAGISRQCLSKWVARWREHGEEGLHDRSSRPRRSPTATSEAVVERIITDLCVMDVTEDGLVLNDPTHLELPGHGNSPGAWAMVALVLVGFVAGCVGLLADWSVVVWIGVALMAVGVVVGIVAGKAGAGRGQHGH